jgi:cytochrome c oxidase cbb3-type subunit III
MRPKTILAPAAFLLLASLAVRLGAQGAPQAPPAPPGPAGQGAPQGAGAPPQGRGRGMGTFPAQQRPPGDPEVIKRGNGLYGVYCRACHGADLRGGDQGGPNLLRSQVVLNDQSGELIVPVVQQGRQNPGMPVMPPLNIPEADVKAIATYIHSVTASARGQGAPPAGPPIELNIVVGDPKAGQAYFNATCTTCHTAAAMQGIATRVSDPMTLQNYWVGGGGGRGGRGGGGGGATQSPVTANVTEASGQKIEGRLVRLDDFYVVVTLADGTSRSFRRDGDVPKIEVKDPREAHRKLLPTYADKDIHDVTAYLVTLK